MQDAIFGPSWIFNAHHVSYFTRGKGRIQVVTPEGTIVLDQEVSAGQLVVIPKHFRVTKQAALDSPLEWADLMTHRSPVSYFLAGKNAEYKVLPFGWMVAGEAPGLMFNHLNWDDFRDLV